MTIKHIYKTLVAFLIIGVSLNVNAAIVEFETFHIRNNSGSITDPPDSDIVLTENAAGDGFLAVTPRSGQKVGYGTNAFDGQQINTITSTNWNTLPSATGNHPYLNMWVTDGANYAVISSENVYMGTDFLTRDQWKIFEYGGPSAGFDWLFDTGIGSRTNQYLQLDGSNVTLADFSDSITLFSGPIGTVAGVGTGAPRGGFGFNVIFGDTQANFATGQGYYIENLTVTIGQDVFEAGNTNTVSAPSVLAIFALGIAGLCFRRFS